MTAIAPICRLCGHGHFKSEPCPTGDVVDARARFTIARAAAIAKRGAPAGGEWSAEQLQAVLARCEHITPPDPRPDGMRTLGELVAAQIERDMDGRVIECEPYDRGPGC